MSRLLAQTTFRKKHPVEQHVVIHWKEGLPKKRDEPWFLMTDLRRSATTLTKLYGKRMTIEELFRDLKSKRNGWALRNTLVRRADRLDRLLLIIVLAYWLLLGLGLHGLKHYESKTWCSTNCTRKGRQECSVFTIGRVLVASWELKPQTLMAVLVSAVIEAGPKWG
jgi:hypothetical protein